MTPENIAALDRLEFFVQENHFPNNRSYKIEWFEDAYSLRRYNVCIFTNETPGFLPAYGEGSHLYLAINEAFKAIEVRHKR